MLKSTMKLTPAQARDKVITTAKMIIRTAGKTLNPACMNDQLSMQINLLQKEKQDLINTLWKYVGTNLRKR
jgi:hypothetical protein